MKKALSVLLCAVLLCACLLPSVHAEDAPLVECALRSNQIYVRFSPAVTDVAEDFYVEGISMDGDKVFIQRRIDPADYTVYRREQIEIVFHFSFLRDEETRRGTSVFDLVLHGLLLSDGTHADQTITSFEFTSSYIRLQPDEKDKMVYPDEKGKMVYKEDYTEYYVPVGAQWPLEYDEDGCNGDAYLQSHAEMTFDGVEPQIQDGTVTFTSLGDCTITIQYCGDFNREQIVVHVVPKSVVQWKLIIQLPFEAFGYGMAVGYWFGPWWLPISLPLGVLHAVAKCILILFMY